jgi:flagellar biogenesis protein FliO
MSSSTIRIMEAPEIADAMALPAMPGRQLRPAFGVPGTLLERILRWIAAAFRRVTGTLKVQRNAKAMRLCETVSLGEKRFLAIVQVDEERILIGGSASSIALLTRLPEKAQFSAVLERSQQMHSA